MFIYIIMRKERKEIYIYIYKIKIKSPTVSLDGSFIFCFGPIWVRGVIVVAFDLLFSSMLLEFIDVQ